MSSFVCKGLSCPCYFEFLIYEKCSWNKIFQAPFLQYWNVVSLFSKNLMVTYFASLKHSVQPYDSWSKINLKTFQTHFVLTLLVCLLVHVLSANGCKLEVLAANRKGKNRLTCSSSYSEYIGILESVKEGKSANSYGSILIAPAVMCSLPVLFDGVFMWWFLKTAERLKP